MQADQAFKIGDRVKFAQSSLSNTPHKGIILGLTSNINYYPICVSRRDRAGFLINDLNRSMYGLSAYGVYVDFVAKIDVYEIISKPKCQQCQNSRCHDLPY